MKKDSTGFLFYDPSSWSSFSVWSFPKLSNLFQLLHKVDKSWLLIIKIVIFEVYHIFAFFKAKWKEFRNIVCDTFIEHLRTLNCVHEDWFDKKNAELQQLIKTRNQARACMLSRNTRSMNAKYRTASINLTARYRELKNDWLLAKAVELQVLADTNDMREGSIIVWGLLGAHLSVTQASYSHAGRQRCSQKSKIFSIDKQRILASC